MIFFRSYSTIFQLPQPYIALLEHIFFFFSSISVFPVKMERPTSKSRSSPSQQNRHPRDWNLGVRPVRKREPRHEAREKLSSYLEQSTETHKKNHSFELLRSDGSTFALFINEKIGNSNNHGIGGGPAVIQQSEASVGKPPPSWIQTLASISDSSFERSEGDNCPEAFYQGWVNGFLVKITHLEWNDLGHFKDQYAMLSDADWKREIKARIAEAEEQEDHYKWAAKRR